MRKSAAGRGARSPAPEPAPGARPPGTPGADQLSKPIPSASIAWRNGPGRPSFASAPITARRMSSTAGVRAGSGGMGNGRARTNRSCSRHDDGIQHEVAQDPGRPARRADPEPRVAQRVVDAPAERLAERHVEPGRGVDRPAPAVREPRSPRAAGTWPRTSAPASGTSRVARRGRAGRGCPGGRSRRSRPTGSGRRATAGSSGTGCRCRTCPRGRASRSTPSASAESGSVISA